MTTMTRQYTYVIFSGGREVENLDPGTYPTVEAAQTAADARLDDLCPPGSPHRRAYRTDVTLADRE